MNTFDIGIDLDGVGFNLQAALAPYARKHGYPLATEAAWLKIDPQTGNYGGFHSWGVPSYEAFLSLCKRASEDGRLFNSGAPFPGFLPMMRDLARDGHRLHLVTGRTDDPSGLVASQTRAWLGMWAIPYRSLTFSSDKTVVPVDFFLEDTVKNYDALLASGMTVPYLISRVWNSRSVVKNRVGTLAEFASEVRRHASVDCAQVNTGGELVFIAPQ